MIGLIFAAALWQAGDTFEDSNGNQVSCEKAQTQLGLNQCAGLQSMHADDALNAQWKKTAARMKQLDTEIERQFDKQPGYHETLLKAQRAWLSFRDAHCLLEGFEARGGTMAPMLEAQCRAAVTQTRTTVLRNLEHDFRNF